jgi:hypothetical protein
MCEVAGFNRAGYYRFLDPEKPAPLDMDLRDEMQKIAFGVAQLRQPADDPGSEGARLGRQSQAGTAADAGSMPAYAKSACMHGAQRGNRLAGKNRRTAHAIPWYIWACALAVTSASFGGVWDISWHESIGRDTFWTAPHLFIHFGGILAGTASAWLIFHTTFSRSPAERAGAVRIWGFYGPLGAFLCCWGGVAMVTSAPFDNWWHAAYGLDVKILSPPHVVLIFGLMAIRLGAVVLILGEMHRAEGVLRRKLQALLLYTFTYLLGVAIAVFQEYTFTDYMHSARVLPGAVAVYAHVPGGGGAGFRIPLGEHRDRRHLHHAEPAVPVAPAAVSRPAEAGAGLSSCDQLHSAAVSAADHRAGPGYRPGCVPGCGPANAGAGPPRSARYSGNFRGGAVAVRRFSAVAGRAQLGLRNAILSLLRATRR